MDKELEGLIKEVSAELVKVNDQIKNQAETANKELKNLGDVTAGTKAKADELLAKQTEVEGRLKDLEQKMARRGEPGHEKPKTAGQLVVENEEVKAFCSANKRGSVKINAALTSESGSGGDLVVPQRLPGIIAPPNRRMTIRDLLMPGRTNSNMVEYVQETGFDNQARIVTEGEAKPESDIEFEMVNTPVRTIAHWVHATRQILADAPMLQSYIDGRLRYGLDFKEELQILKGDGSGLNLEGLVTQATPYSAAFVPSNPTRIDELRLAILQATLAEYPVNGIVLHPTDWAQIELTKDELGLYIMANPLQMAGPVLWGKPIVETQAMDLGEFLTGGFGMAAQIFDREDATVEISTEDRDNFIKNMVTILAEKRLALAVHRPEALITGAFTYNTN